MSRLAGVILLISGCAGHRHAQRAPADERRAVLELAAKHYSASFRTRGRYREFALTATGRRGALIGHGVVILQNDVTVVDYKQPNSLSSTGEGTSRTLMFLANELWDIDVLLKTAGRLRPWDTTFLMSNCVTPTALSVGDVSLRPDSFSVQVRSREVQRSCTYDRVTGHLREIAISDKQRVAFIDAVEDDLPLLYDTQKGVSVEVMEGMGFRIEALKSPPFPF